MSDHMTLPSELEEEDVTVRLLHEAHPRAAVSTARAERVRSAVREAWHAETRRRASRRRVAIALSLAAALVLIVAGRGTFVERTVSLGDPVATIEQLDGASSRQRNGRVRIGEWIETGAESRIGLRFGDGTSVRVDTQSRVRALSPAVIELSAGAVYVDTGSERRAFEVRTSLATARDIGTQFELRLIGDSLRLRVRTGIVELTNGARTVSGRARTEITLSANGAVSRPIAAHGAEWSWTTRVSPLLEMEGMSLASFLERVAREQGWTVEHRDPATARDAERIILHGSVSGLTPHEAVEVAIATSGLRHQFEGGSLVVLREDARAAGDRDGAR